MVHFHHSTQHYEHRFGKVKGAAEGCSSLKGLIWMSQLNVVAVAYAVAANVVQCCRFILEELLTLRKDNKHMC